MVRIVRCSTAKFNLSAKELSLRKVFGKSFITVLHSSQTTPAEIEKKLGKVKYVETRVFVTYAREEHAVSIFSAPSDTASEQATNAFDLVTRIFPTKRHALAYIQEKIEHTGLR